MTDFEPARKGETWNFLALHRCTVSYALRRAEGIPARTLKPAAYSRYEGAAA